MLNFSTSAEMFDAGYAIPVYNINASVQCWRYRDEEYRTFSCPTERNREPDIPLARIELVRERAIG